MGREGTIGACARNGAEVKSQMNRRHSTLLNSVRACLNVAESPEYKSVWSSSPPADFRKEIQQVAADFEAVTTKYALALAATGGAGDAKAAAKAALENSTHVLARALALHFRRTGDLDRRGKVDMSRSKILRHRAQELVSTATALRDLAVPVVGEPGAEDRGITAELLDEHSRVLAAFTVAMGSPRGQIANRGALLHEVEADIPALMKKLRDLDDLVLQFHRTPAGRRFIEAWRRARIIVDAGGSPSEPAATDSPPEAPHAAPVSSIPVAQL